LYIFSRKKILRVSCMTTLKQLVIEARALLVAPTTNIKKVNFLVDNGCYLCYSIGNC